MKFEIPFRWEDVESGPGQPYQFPDNPTPHMKKYRVPSVYRWAILSQDGNLEATYVGEAEDSERRLKNYLKPGKTQYTSLRIRATLDEYHTQGKEIRFQVIAFDEFVVNTSKFDCKQLSDPFARAVIENLIVLEAKRSGCKVLNKGTDITQKKVELALKSVTSTFTAKQKEVLVKKLMNSVKGN